MLDLTTPSLLFSAISLILLAYTNRFLSYASVGPHIERKTPADTRSERYCTDCKPPQTALPDPFDADTRDTQSAPLRNFHVLYLYFMANHCRLDIRCRTAATGRFPMRMYLGNKHFRQGSRNTFTRHKF